MIADLHAMVQAMSAKRNDQLIGWGMGAIGALLATIGWLLTTYVFK